MPNHVTTRCIVTGPAAAIRAFKALAFVPDDKGAPSFDFNRIIPMPSQLEGAEASTDAERGAELIVMRATAGAPYADIHTIWGKWVREDVNMPKDHIRDVAKAFLAKHPEIEAKGRVRLQNILETGYADWYQWSIDTWGTKWGAYAFKIVSDTEGRLEFVFETAWSFPTPIFERLAERYQGLAFQCATFDEGSNFSGAGYFNPPRSKPPFTITDPADEALYESVYGFEREVEEED